MSQEYKKHQAEKEELKLQQVGDEAECLDSDIDIVGETIPHLKRSRQSKAKRLRG